MSPLLRDQGSIGSHGKACRRPPLRPRPCRPCWGRPRPLPLARRRTVHSHPEWDEGLSEILRKWDTRVAGKVFDKISPTPDHMTNGVDKARKPSSSKRTTIRVQASIILTAGRAHSNETNPKFRSNEKSQRRSPYVQRAARRPWPSRNIVRRN